MNAAHEYPAARNGAGMVDLGARGRIVVRGADRKTFLHALLTNDIALLAARDGVLRRPAHAPGADDRRHERVRARRRDARRRAARGEGRAAPALRPADLQRGRPARRRDRRVGLPRAYTGRRRRQIAGGVVGADLAGFGPFQNARLERGGEIVVAARRDALGLTGFLLFAAGSAMPELAQALHAAGAAVLPAEAAEALRVEAGEPAFLVDMGDDTIPPEAGIETAAVSYPEGLLPRAGSARADQGPRPRQGRAEARRA